MAQRGHHKHSGRKARRYFTVAEANCRINRVREALQLLLALRATAKRLHVILEQCGFPASCDEDDQIAIQLPEGIIEPPRGVLVVAGQLRALYAVISDQFSCIQDLGCVLRSVETGSVNWPAIYHGRRIWLSWSYGDSEVLHWREHHASTQSRRPIAELALEAA